ncbi:hemoglobin subunit beta-like isoform X3 [Esox lucius]|uniref:hemoglobin subunit beta-like isoform X3 n=1 Tax=Esox lucius TaxID=8010 RepID=UPI001476DEDA|nr:hemoglobin subunit beta-like isoform X3 [Esox lucius]XP_034150904.1 hemoglobin subunit beta-like isoform X3 [Esox lucius]XP_034150905.1 hemoglobin subunit beta-like isoform X3 [Esox lucius]XP_034150906.1 hemoglobin subunit beta-like isoform X3 [Esox lucius]
MVQWTSTELSAIEGVWGRISTDEIGAQAVARLLIVFPWIRWYFSRFGNLADPAAIMSNLNVISHGKTVMRALDKAVQNPFNIENTFAALSVIHSEKLHVDPDNFLLLADCITVCIAAKLGPTVFNVDTHEAFHKFMCEVVSAFKKRYH